MKFFTKGDKSKAICERCRAMSSTVFAYCDVPFSDGSGVVKGILVGVCERCGDVVSIPAQSTPAISKSRAPAPESIEAMLPAPYLDLLDLACFKIDPEAPLGLRKGLLMFYVHRFATGSFEVERLRKSSAALALRPGMESKHRRRLSIKTTSRLARELSDVAELCGMRKTEAIKAIVGAIQEDVVDGGCPELIQTLRDCAVFASA